MLLGGEQFPREGRDELFKQLKVGVVHHEVVVPAHGARTPCSDDTSALEDT